MANPRADWRGHLVKAHPRLFHNRKRDPERNLGYPTCGDGWRDLLERACARIEAALAERDTFRVVQIKEKFASLRFYWSGNVSSDAKFKIAEAIALAMARSSCTCEECGEEGRLHRVGGMYATRCATHAVGKPVPIKLGQENILVITDGGAQTFSRRYYDRATDTFIDILPDAPETEE